MNLSKFKKKSNAGYKPSNYLDGVQERRDFRNKMKAELKSMAQESFIEQFEMLKYQDKVFERNEVHFSDPINKRAIENSYQELENEIKKLKSTVEELQTLKSTLALNVNVSNPMSSSPPYAVIPISPSGNSNNLWSIDTFPFFQPNSNNNQNIDNQSNIKIHQSNTESPEIGLVANANPNSNMFVLSTAPIKSRDVTRNNEQFNGNNINNTEIALSVEQQARRLQELQNLFTIPSNIDDEDLRLARSRKTDTNNVTFVNLQRRDQSINDYVNRMEYSKNLKQKPSVLSPRSQAYKNNRVDQSVIQENSKRRVTNNINNNQYLNTNSVDNGGFLASSLENSEHNVDTILSAEEFYQITESMRDEIRQLVLKTVKQELDANGKSKYYTKREIANSISRNKDSISDRVEKRVGDRIAALQQELEYLRIEKIDIPIIQNSYNEPSNQRPSNIIDLSDEMKGTRHKKNHFTNNDDLSDLSDISNIKKIKKNERNKKLSSKSKSKKNNINKPVSTESEGLDETEIIVDSKVDTEIILEDAEQVIKAEPPKVVEKVNMATQVSVPSSPLVVSSDNNKAAVIVTSIPNDTKIDPDTNKEYQVYSKPIDKKEENPNKISSDNNSSDYIGQLHSEKIYDSSLENKDRDGPNVQNDQTYQDINLNRNNFSTNNYSKNDNKYPDRNISVSFNEQQSYQESKQSNYRDNQYNESDTYGRNWNGKSAPYNDRNIQNNVSFNDQKTKTINFEEDRFYEDNDNSGTNLNAPNYKQRSQKLNQRPRSRVRSRGSSSESDRGSQKYKQTDNNSIEKLNIINDTPANLSIERNSKNEVTELQKEYKNILTTMAQLNELKGIIKQEIKEWTKEFEEKNKRVPTNVDKALIDDKFVTKELASAKELSIAIEERMKKI